MIEVQNLLSFFKKNKINSFSGVPDSILKEFINILPNNQNIITANEGGAVAFAVGYYLATKKLPLVYMQNSGLSNAINPLISIAHQKVYSIPLILMIGWRGAPGTKDEPQHLLKGKITKDILKLLGIKFCVIDNEKDLKKLSMLIKYSLKRKKPIAFLIKNKKLFNEKKQTKINIIKNSKILRSFVINELLKKVKKDARIVSTVGFTSRELFQIRKEKNYKAGKDFYMVGGMGHASMVALGCSLNTNKQIICLDGDGSIMMHLGALISTGFKAKNNFKHILLNNGSHESVGNQKIDTLKVNFKKISESFAYKNYYYANSNLNFKKMLKCFLNSKGPSFFEIIIDSISLKNLSRPKHLIDIKKNFLNS
jgi:phosphonopyruvate decarboxylase